MQFPDALLIRFDAAGVPRYLTLGHYHPENGSDFTTYPLGDRVDVADGELVRLQVVRRQSAAGVEVLTAMITIDGCPGTGSAAQDGPGAH